MKITCIATGSTGNCFLVETGEHRLLLEAGVPYQKTMDKIGFELPDAVLASHQHGDHAKYLTAFAVKGVPVICNDATANACGILNWQRDTGQNFGVRMLPAVHDVPCEMFLIDNTKTGERLLFATDTESIPHKIDGITQLLIECNYSMHTIEENERADRVRNSHLSLEILCEWLGQQDTSKLKEINLVHLSDSNSHQGYFESTIGSLLGIPVYVH